MTHIVTLDFETFWRSKDYTLSKMSPIEYIRDPRFQAQLLGITIDRGPVQVFECAEIPKALAALSLDNPDRITVAHNGNGFDFMILSEIYGVRPAWMLDTMVLMRWLGISSLIAENHASLTAYFQTGEKKQGTIISDGKQWPQDFTPAEREAFRMYCGQDVTQCRDNLYKMLGAVGPGFLPVLRFCTLTAKMATEPMLMLNKQMLLDYKEQLIKQTEQARNDVSKLFHFASNEEFLKAIRSAPTFCTMLRQLGVEPPMKYSEAKSKTRKTKMEAAGEDTTNPESWAVYSPALSKQDLEFTAMMDDPDERVALLVRTRLENNSSIQMSRTETFIRLADGRPCPVLLQAFKAHTSRYAAGNSEGATSGTNWQNLSKRDPKALAIRKAVQARPNYKIVACDSSQIEARMLAYEAQQLDLLGHFVHGRDPYAEMAALFKPQYTATEIHDKAKAGDKECKRLRNLGKLFVLSAGYGVGSRKVGDTLLRQKIRLSSDLETHYELAKGYHSTYRQASSSIVAFWNYCGNVIEHMAMGGEGYFGGPNKDLFHYGMMEVAGAQALVPSVMLPSGFALRYPGLRAQANEDTGKVEYVYNRRIGKNLTAVRLYGPALVENLTQSLSFQLLMWQAIEMQKAGIHIICNIHDSFATMVPEAEAEATAELMLKHMSTVPPWLPGFPVAAEAEIADDFTIA